MDFLKRIFGGGGAPRQHDGGFFVYVRIKRTGEVVRLRFRPGYDISLNDSGTPFARKLIVGQRGFEKVDAAFYFDKNYNLVEAELDGGELADEDAYLDQQAAE